MPMAMAELTMRFRSSSRWDQNDILPFSGFAVLIRSLLRNGGLLRLLRLLRLRFSGVGGLWPGHSAFHIGFQLLNVDRALGGADLGLDGRLHFIGGLLEL